LEGTTIRAHATSGFAPSLAALLVARVLSAGQGAIWLILLIHGGKGLLFGPMAWIAAMIGHRISALAVILLIVPLAWLSFSWAPILAERPRPIDWTHFGALTGPAAAAAVIFLGRLVATMAIAVHRRI
jgi:hypothetical protein